MTVTVRKTVPSPEAVQILYQRMRYEYDFYHYVKEQFHLLKRKFGLKSRVSKTPLRPQFFIPTPLETEEPIDDDEQDDEKWLEDIYKRWCQQGVDSNGFISLFQKVFCLGKKNPEGTKLMLGCIKKNKTFPQVGVVGKCPVLRVLFV